MRRCEQRSHGDFEGAEAPASVTREIARYSDRLYWVRDRDEQGLPCWHLMYDAKHSSLSYGIARWYGALEPFPEPVRDTILEELINDPRSQTGGWNDAYKKGQRRKAARLAEFRADHDRALDDYTRAAAHEIRIREGKAIGGVGAMAAAKEALGG
ncbi:MAG: hypothetical protein V1929_12710 [bacterium]